MKADVLDLHFLGSLKKHSQALAEHNTALNRLSKKLEVVHNDWHETKTSLYQEQMKMVDTLLEIFESDINKEEALDARLKKLELDIERIYELMAQQVTETKPLVVTETLQNLEFAELEKPKSLAKPAVKKVFDDKENKKPITSEYAKYFNDKTVPKVEVKLFEEVVEKKEIKATTKQPVKHAKTKSVGVDPFKKK